NSCNRCAWIFVNWRAQLTMFFLVLALTAAHVGFPCTSWAQVSRQPQPSRPDNCVEARREEQRKLLEAERVTDYYRGFAENTQKELAACTSGNAASGASRDEALRKENQELRAELS